MSLSRDAILGASDVQIETVDVPEWGDKVHVKGLTGRELDDYQNSLRKIVRDQVVVQPNAHSKLLVKALVDERGDRLFGDKDVDALARKSGRVLDRLWDVAARLSGITDEEQEEIEGNSDAALSGDSTSDSPETSE
ncbi:hypothetical protein [Streptomyces sp. DW26H14]|uniref:hypothetical protein n=1 Tax=Streptomyces sp. DW26H14 TaxID=3435395 RepID=UPI00403DAFF3